jgi:hypothetical protein
MSDKKDKKGPKGDLVSVVLPGEKGLTLEQAMAHPVVQQMNKKLEEMRQVIEGLPEAIGRAVAEAQRSGRTVSRAFGPPVALKTDNANVEFHRKGRIVQDGKEVAPEGQTQRDFVKDLGAVRGQWDGTLPSLPALPTPPAKRPAEPDTKPPADSPAEG